MEVFSAASAVSAFNVICTAYVGRGFSRATASAFVSFVSFALFSRFDTIQRIWPSVLSSRN
jgi:hypothetical protein